MGNGRKSRLGTIRGTVRGQGDKDSKRAKRVNMARLRGSENTSTETELLPSGTKSNKEERSKKLTVVLTHVL